MAHRKGGQMYDEDDFDDGYDDEEWWDEEEAPGDAPVAPPKDKKSNVSVMRSARFARLGFRCLIIR